MDHSHYTLWDYKSGEKISSKCVMIRNKDTVCFHPTQDKAFFPGDCNSNKKEDKDAFFVKYDNDGTAGKVFYCHQYGISSGLFSKKEPILFMVDKEKLIFYDYEKTAIHFHALKKKMGTLFAYPTDNEPYFLSSDYAQENMYRITQVDGDFIIKKLFKFPFVIDVNNWIYNPHEKLFFFINKKHRMLYAISIKDSKKIKSKKYRCENGFSIATMAIHPSEKNLVLSSQKSNQIQFVDVRNYENIRHILTLTPELSDTDSHHENKDKKIIFSQDGENVLTTSGKKCLVIDIPSFIKYVDPFEKTCMIKVFEQYAIARDVRKLIWWFLFRLSR